MTSELCKKSNEKKIKIILVPCLTSSLLNSYNDIGGALAKTSHRSILIEIPKAGKAGQENDLSIAPMCLTNLQLAQLGDCYILKSASASR